MWLLLASWLSGPALAAPSCNNRGITRVVRALDDAGPEHRVLLAAAGVAEACRLKPAVEGVLEQLASTPPDYRATLDLKLVEQAPRRWNVACRGGLKAAAKVGELAARDKRQHLWTSCLVARHGFATHREWTREADGLMIAPILLSSSLKSAGVPRHLRKPVVRALAGLEP